MKKKLESEFERKLNIQMAENFLAEQAAKQSESQASHDLAYGQHNRQLMDGRSKKNDASTKLDDFMKRKNLTLNAQSNDKNKPMRINSSL